MKKVKVGIYKLDEGGYQTSYVHPLTARRIRNKFATSREAKFFAKGLKDRIANPTVGSDQFVSQLVRDFIERNPTTNMCKRSPFLFDSFLDTFGKRQIQEVGKLHLEQWLAHIKSEKGYSSRTMLQCKYAFTPFFSELVELGILDRNPLAEVYIKQGTRVKERVFLSESELKQILDRLKIVSADLTFPVTYFLVHTGCKIKEALSLKWDQLDFKNGTVHFRSAPTSDERTIRLSPKLLEFLRILPNRSEFVFLDDRARPWTGGYYGKRLARDRTHVGLGKRWDNFSFRHTFAYHFLRKGGTLQQLQVVLGHRHIADTEAAYGDIIARKEEKSSPYS